MLGSMGFRTVLLRHELPDGASHFDWMFAADEPASARLATWRCAIRPDLAAVGEIIPLEPLGPHRAEYLAYEGPLTGGRGIVERVAAGWWHPGGGMAPAATLCEGGELQIVWDGAAGRQEWVLTPGSATRRA